MNNNSLKRENPESISHRTSHRYQTHTRSNESLISDDENKKIKKLQLIKVKSKESINSSNSSSRMKLRASSLKKNYTPRNVRSRAIIEPGEIITDTLKAIESDSVQSFRKQIEKHKIMITSPKPSKPQTKSNFKAQAP